MKTTLISRAIFAAMALASVVTGEPAASGAFPPPSPELLLAPPARERPKGMHPRVVLRDGQGQPVVVSGGWVSFGTTCGDCHDVAWIGQHGDHFRLGVDEQTAAGQARSGRAWDFGPGLFGRWDPLAGYASVLSDPKRQGASVDRWISENLARLVGGGPALRGEEAERFEPNCALCHLRGAVLSTDRRLPLMAHQSSTLQGVGLVGITLDEQGVAHATWNQAAFAADGSVDPAKFALQAPTSAACGKCHGFAGRTEPSLGDWGVRARQTETTGQLFLASRISDSALNVAGRSVLTRPWDVHAERLLECRDCHFSPNDPGSAFRSRGAKTEHLWHEARNLSLGEYLRRPSHELAKGYSAEGHASDAQDGTMRRCEDCHDALRVHRWLPKAERHLEQVGCEACHIPTVHAPSRRVTDYSLIDAEGRPRVEYRGIVGSIGEPTAYLPSYRPLLLRRTDASGKRRLLPYNIVTSYYWVVDGTGGSHPASMDLLKRAFVEEKGMSQLILLLDRNKNGKLDDAERALSQEKDVAAAQSLLVAAGATNPRLVGEMQAYGIHHGVAPARFALRDCAECHGSGSRLEQPMVLTEQSPFGITPGLVSDSNVMASFAILPAASGGLLLAPDITKMGLHVFGSSRRRWLDLLGAVTVALVMVGALGHGALRIWSSRQRRRRSA